MKNLIARGRLRGERGLPVEGEDRELTRERVRCVDTAREETDRDRLREI